VVRAVILDGAPVFHVALQAMVDAEQFRVLLEGERDRKYALLKALRQDISSVSAARKDANVDDEHDPEGSTIAFELSQATALLEQSRAGLEQIEAALERISDGSFGFCVVCGAAIPEGRLEARPWTPFCIEHASGR
jgi:RNA polymerase-binding transcription factor DksA